MKAKISKENGKGKGSKKSKSSNGDEIMDGNDFVIDGTTEETSTGTTPTTLVDEDTETPQGTVQGFESSPTIMIVPTVSPSPDLSSRVV